MSTMRPERTAVILGGSRGVGRAIARYLAERGVTHLFNVFLEQVEAAESLTRELESCGVKVTSLQYNLGVAEDIQTMAERIRKLTSQIDYLVHCVALTTFKPLMRVRPNQWDLTMAVSTRSFVHVVQLLSDLMPRGSSVVAISSTGSQRFNANYGALGVSKSALESTVRYLAVELAGKGIRVNGVISGLLGGASLPLFPEIQEVVKQTLERTPSGRLGTPDDIAEAVYFLLTGASWMTGQHLILDGGFCLT